MTSTVRPERSGPDELLPDSTSPDRHAAMVEAMSEVRPARTGEFPLETVLLILGGVCLPAGLVAIIAGWYGVSHTGHIYEQNSYLISGGLFGLGLVFVGGFLYFGYWMTRHIHATNSATQQTLRAISRLEEQLGAVAVSLATSAGNVNGDKSRATARPRRSTGAVATGSFAAGSLVATERGTLVHRPNCPVVANKEHLRSVDPDAPGFGPCRICRPFDDN